MTPLAVAVPVSTLWTSPQAPRDVDAPAVADMPDVAAWCAAMDLDSRRDLHGRTLTQLLLGEPVDVVEEAGDWLGVVACWQPSSQDARGYPGWLPRAHVAPFPELPPEKGPAAVAGLDGSRHWAVVPTPEADLHVGERCWQVSWATTLPVVASTSQSVTVALPGGSRGAYARSAVTLRPTGAGPGPAPEHIHRPDWILRSARRLLGVHYLWGGTSGAAVDCSGLVHLAYREHGRVVPRDAHDQHRAATAVDLVRAAPGDLYFFARPGQDAHHVGFVSGAGRMLHAPQSGERVEEAPLGEDRVATLYAAGRFTGHEETPVAMVPG